jgi:polynucleotide 5'-kinase involved in rRNA processing
MNIEKIHKYTYKYINNPKQIYMNKLNFYGGSRYNGDNFNSIMEYVSKKLSSTIANKKTKDTSEPKTEKHLIMLYGPPASGKSKAKEIILNKPY